MVRTTGAPLLLVYPRRHTHKCAAPWTYKRKGRYSHKYSRFNLNIMSRSCLVTFSFKSSDSRVLIGCGKIFPLVPFLRIVLVEVILIRCQVCPIKLINLYIWRVKEIHSTCTRGISEKIDSIFVNVKVPRWNTLYF